uniref:DNA topoisomerase VI subunit B transducer domain-containing protein n=1 Tax=Lactuca sativa TaxID=4236 RepID=A0A9R1WDL5_LACSA|nr:hypothetical protein LSAT_V11C100048450 [Lactuca sativa]
MQEKIGVFVNIVSTKIPFKGTGMEYIGDDISEIAEAVKTCLEDCCNQLKSLIIKQNMDFYIDQVSTAHANILEIRRQLNGSDTELVTKEKLAQDLHEQAKRGLASLTKLQTQIFRSHLDHLLDTNQKNNNKMLLYTHKGEEKMVLLF